MKLRMPLALLCPILIFAAFSSPTGSAVCPSGFLVPDVIEYGFRPLVHTGVFRCWTNVQTTPVAGVPIVGWLAFAVASAGAWALRRKDAPRSSASS